MAMSLDITLARSTLNNYHTIIENLKNAINTKLIDQKYNPANILHDLSLLVSREKINTDGITSVKHLDYSFDFPYIEEIIGKLKIPEDCGVVYLEKTLKRLRDMYKKLHDVEESSSKKISKLEL